MPFCPGICAPNSMDLGSVRMRGRWLSVPITGDCSAYKLEWIQATPLGFPCGYTPARPADFQYMTLTTCPGDFRTTSSYVAPAGDPSLIQQCRNQVIAEAGLY